MACFFILTREVVRQPGLDKREEVEPFTQIRQVVLAREVGLAQIDID